MRGALKLLPTIVILALALGGPAAAQEAVDPIGSLLDQVDEETAEVQGESPAAATPTPVPASPPPVQTLPPSTPTTLPAAPAYPYNPAPDSPPPPISYAPPARPVLTAPVNIDEHDKTPEAPLNYVERGYENRLRSSFASAQGMQGPMDGAWVLRAGSGQTLYTLVLVDRGLGMLEGAWRDPRRKGAVDASGFLSNIQRTGAEISASFYPRTGAGATMITLTPGVGGAWSGELVEDGARTSVSLRRN